MNSDHDFQAAYMAYTRAHIEANEQLFRSGELWELTPALAHASVAEWDDLSMLAIQAAKTHAGRMEAVEWVRQGSSTEVLVLGFAIRTATTFDEIQPLIARIRRRMERLNESRRIFRGIFSMQVCVEEFQNLLETEAGDARLEEIAMREFRQLEEPTEQQLTDLLAVCPSGGITHHMCFVKLDALLREEFNRLSESSGASEYYNLMDRCVDGMETRQLCLSRLRVISEGRPSHVGTTYPGYNPINLGSLVDRCCA